MQLSDHLTPEGVVIDLAAASKQDLLSKLAELAARKSDVGAEAIAAALNTREGLGSTGIGQGIAIPHCVIDKLEDSVCMFVRLSRRVDFEAIDDIPVDIVVLLLTSPTQQGQSLNILSCIARRLRDERLTSAVRAARTADEVFVLLTAG